MQELTSLALQKWKKTHKRLPKHKTQNFTIMLQERPFIPIMEKGDFSL